MLLLQSGDEPVHRIGDGHVDQDELCLDADAGFPAGSRILGLLGRTHSGFNIYLRFRSGYFRFSGFVFSSKSEEYRQQQKA